MDTAGVLQQLTEGIVRYPWYLNNFKGTEGMEYSEPGNRACVCMLSLLSRWERRRRKLVGVGYPCQAT